MKLRELGISSRRFHRVKINNVHKSLCKTRGIEKIASAISRPKCLDKRTEGSEYLAYARVCVEIEADRELLESLLVRIGPGQSIVVRFEYEWKPFLCTHCACFGYSTVKCKMRPQQKQKQGLVVKNTQQRYPEKEGPHSLQKDNV